MKEAFMTMYHENIVHRDIKPENIMIHNNQIKIADFGFARNLEEMVFIIILINYLILYNNYNFIKIKRITLVI